MNISKNSLKLDLSVQILLLGVMYAGVFVSLIMWDPQFLGFYVFGEFFIGLWQLLSAIVVVLRYNDQWRKDYLKIVALYFCSFYLAMLCLEPMPNQIFDYAGFVMLTVVPAIIAIWYTFHTYFDLAKAERNLS